MSFYFLCKQLEHKSFFLNNQCSVIKRRRDAEFERDCSRRCNFISADECLVSSINSDSRGTELAASSADLFVLRTRLPIEPGDGFTSISEHAVGIFPRPIPAMSVLLLVRCRRKTKTLIDISLLFSVLYDPTDRLGC